MKPIVLNTHKFSHGVLQVDFSLIYPFDECMSVSKVKFSEFIDGDYTDIDGDQIDVVRKSSSYDADAKKQRSAKYIVQLNSNENHLVKATVYIDHSKAKKVTLPCCMQVDTETDMWLYEEFFVDLTAYETSFVSSISLKCDNCEVPAGNVTSLLNIFAVEAVVDSHDPKMEYIYSKIACGKTVNVAPKRLTTKCNCNG